MRIIDIEEADNGIRLNKYIKKLFNNIPDGLVYKLIRKGQFSIIHNDKKTKAKKDDILYKNDKLLVFLNDDSFEDLTKNKKESVNIHINQETKKKLLKNIIYEDENLIVYNKDSGLLSQNDKKDDVSVNSLLNNYINDKNEKVKGVNFNPTIVNRLDRNTKGLILFAKNYLMARELTEMFKEKTLDNLHKFDNCNISKNGIIKNNKQLDDILDNDNIHKYYIVFVNGHIECKDGFLYNLYKKNETKNIAEIYDFNVNKSVGDLSRVLLKYKVIEESSSFSKVLVELVTGKSHQIRAQFSHIGHPLLCDKKYMNIELYNKNIKDYGSNFNNLICYKMILGKFTNEKFKNLDKKEFCIDVKS